MSSWIYDAEQMPCQKLMRHEPRVGRSKSTRRSASIVVTTSADVQARTHTCASSCRESRRSRHDAHGRPAYSNHETRPFVPPSAAHEKASRARNTLRLAFSAQEVKRLRSGRASRSSGPAPRASACRPCRRCTRGPCSCTSRRITLYLKSVSFVFVCTTFGLTGSLPPTTRKNDSGWFVTFSRGLLPRPAPTAATPRISRPLLEGEVVGHLAADAQAVRHDPLAVDGVGLADRAQRLRDEFGLARRPAARVLRLRADQDHVVVVAERAPAVGEVLDVGLLVLAERVQPDDDRVGDVRVVGVGDVDPVGVVRRRVVFFTRPVFGFFAGAAGAGGLAGALTPGFDQRLLRGRVVRRSSRGRRRSPRRATTLTSSIAPRLALHLHRQRLPRPARPP